MRGAGEQEPRDGARGVGAVFDHRLVDAGDQAAAAERRLRMGEHQRLAAVQFLHHRLEGGIAQPFVAIAGEQHDAVGLERVEAVFELAQAGFDVGQRQRREHAEAAGMVGGELRRIVVALARDAAALRVVADPDAGRGDRGDRGGDAGLVHVGERLLRRPGDGRRLQQRAHLLDVFRRRDVMMDVDAMRLGGARGRRAASRAHGRDAAGGCGGQDAATGRYGAGAHARRGERTALRRRNQRRAADAAAKRQPSGRD